MHTVYDEIQDYIAVESTFGDTLGREKARMPRLWEGIQSKIQYDRTSSSNPFVTETTAKFDQNVLIVVYGTVFVNFTFTLDLARSILYWS